MKARKEGTVEMAGMEIRQGRRRRSRRRPPKWKYRLTLACRLVGRPWHDGDSFQFKPAREARSGWDERNEMGKSSCRGAGAGVGHPWNRTTVENGACWVAKHNPENDEDSFSLSKSFSWVVYTCEPGVRDPTCPLNLAWWVRTEYFFSFFTHHHLLVHAAAGMGLYLIMLVIKCSGSQGWSIGCSVWRSMRIREEAQECSWVSI